MNWQTKKLGEIARVFAGSSAPQGGRYFSNGKYPFVRVSDLGGAKNKNLVNVRNQINDLALSELRPVLAKKGTIVFPKSGAAIATNARAILGVDAYIVSHLAAIEADTKKVLTDWLYLFLFDFDMTKLSANSAYPSLQLARIKEIQIPLPPIGEQRKIVKRIEKLFAKIDEAQKLREESKKSASALLQSALNEIFSSPKSPPLLKLRRASKKWEEKELGRVCKLNMGQSPASSTYNSSKNGLPFYQGKKDYGEKYPTPRVWCSNPIKVVEAGDILISVRAPVGALNIAKEKSCIGRGLTGLRSGEKLEQGFLYYFLKLKQKDISDMGTGSTFTAISKKHLEDLKIPLPPLAEQKKIVAYLDSLSEKVRILRQVQDETAANFSALRQSVLSQAFSRTS